MTNREGEGRGYTVPVCVKRSIRRMASSGRKVSEIARATGVSRATVRKVLIVFLDDEGERDDDRHEDQRGDDSCL